MLSGSTNEEKIWNFLRLAGLNAFGAAGLMGNLYAESGLSPANLQNTCEKKLGYTDETYTAAVDSGVYTDFVRDSAGYGLAQWTYRSRKQNLLDYAKNAGKSIGDREMQLEFLLKELTGYGLLNTLKTASGVRAASDVILTRFEKPADQSEAVKVRRAGYGQVYFDKYEGNRKGEGQTVSNSPLVTYTNLTSHCNSPRGHAIDTITIHCYVGQVTAKQGCDFFVTTPWEASSNYVVGWDGSIGLSVEEKNRSWCSDSPENDYRAITIEVACDATHPYAVTDAAYNALIELCADICKRNGIKQLLWKGDKSLIGQVDKQNMTVHRWFAAKACPGDYLYERHGAIADAVNKKLEDEDMDAVRFKELWTEMRRELQDNDSSAWSGEAREWAVSSGLVQGGSAESANYMWEDVLTREQMVMILYRFAQMLGKA